MAPLSPATSGGVEEAVCLDYALSFTGQKGKMANCLTSLKAFISKDLF